MLNAEKTQPSGDPQSDETATSSNSCGSDEAPKRKIPFWAILLAIVCFIIFNSFFFVFATQMGNGGGTSENQSETENQNQSRDHN